ncbi:MAG TPA: DegV family protein [Anaerolineae bacterium]|nr:DegV family protein [Anaerolineae bacterium]
MSRIAIITDSSSGLSQELIARHELHVLPYYILAGGRMLHDGIQISRDEVFRLLRDGRHLPQTKAPTPDDFAALFRSLLGRVDAALVILPPRERTSAYQHARSAGARIPELPITLIDSRQVSAGQALVVLAAARARDAGGDLDAVVKAAEAAVERMEFWIVLASLKFAARSGRVPNLEQHQPVWQAEDAAHARVPLMRHEHGAPHIVFSANSADAAIERLKRELVDRVQGQQLHVAITHAGEVVRAESIRAWAQSTWSPCELRVFELPPILAVYSGPGAMGVAVYSDSPYVVGQDFTAESAEDAEIC